jgi:DNA-binding transcriptional ArsR family regulator
VHAPETDPFDALGDPIRRRLLEMLGREPQSVSALAEQVPVSRPAVSRHLRVLKQAGLVQEEAHGTRRIYHLREDGTAVVRAYLEQVWGEAATRLRLMAENTTEVDPS